MAEMGRPTVFDEITIQKLEDAFSVGATDLEAAFMANISKSSLYNYFKSNPDFLDRTEALKEMLKFKAKKVISKAIEEDDNDTAKWYLERKAKNDGFSSRQELTGAEGEELKAGTTNIIFYDKENDTIGTAVSAQLESGTTSDASIPAPSEIQDNSNASQGSQNNSGDQLSNPSSSGS